MKRTASAYLRFGYRNRQVWVEDTGLALYLMAHVNKPILPEDENEEDVVQRALARLSDLHESKKDKLVEQQHYIGGHVPQSDDDDLGEFHHFYSSRGATLLVGFSPEDLLNAFDREAAQMKDEKHNLTVFIEVYLKFLCGGSVY